MAGVRKKTIVPSDTGSFRITGIASNEKPFSVCWEINRLLNAGLTLGEPLTRFRRELNDTLSFMAFRAEDDNGNRLLLIENITPAGFFMDKFKTFHYLLIAEGHRSAETTATIMATLKTSPMILLCAPVELKTKQEITFIKSYLL